MTGTTRDYLEYNKLKVGTKTIDDAILNIGSLKRTRIKYADKSFVLRALYNKDVFALREISNYFYRTSGIYSKACNYLAYLYRYDWYVVPEVLSDKVNEKTVLTEFNNVLNFLDNTHIKSMCGRIAQKVIVDGAYYGYVVKLNDKVIIQELPINYCRSRFFSGNNAVIEFNMSFFDECFRDINTRLRVLKAFPKDIQKGYLLYKEGKLSSDCIEDAYGKWYVLDSNETIKFSLYNNDVPFLVNAIPDILDLDAAQDLDRRKQMQKLLKIIVQKLPLDKNGDLIFDVDEARDIHNNAVEMLKFATGTDVLTTFTDVDSIDVADSNTATSSDDLERVERTVYNSLGISQNLFNANGNISLEKSTLNDESSIRDLLFQFHMFFDDIAQSLSKSKKKYNFRLYMLETTQFNYKDIAKMYKEQVQIGYSKMLPQIAMGHSQSSIIHTAHFENEILHLSELMIPPLQSSTLNAEGLQALSAKNKDKGNTSDSSNSQDNLEENTGGRPELEETEKSDKTLQNEQSMT